jgi:hypothetical protein
MWSVALRWGGLSDRVKLKTRSEGRASMLVCVEQVPGLGRGTGSLTKVWDECKRSGSDEALARVRQD